MGLHIHKIAWQIRSICLRRLRRPHQEGRRGLNWEKLGKGIKIQPYVSVIVPARNEAQNLVQLISDIDRALESNDFDFEIIVVDDGSDDSSLEVLDKARKDYARLRVLSHAISAGQSAALHSGITAAQGALICTLDGDGQNPPKELPNLLAPLIAHDKGKKGQGEALALIAGQRKKRQDSLSKKIASRFANGLRNMLLKDGVRDTGCGLKAFYRDAFLELPYFNNMHRYLPALFKRAGYDIMVVDVSHRAREKGRSNYSNFGRALAGVADLLGVMWLRRRAKKVKARERDKPDMNGE